MSIIKNRVKVSATGTNQTTDFTLGNPIKSFSSFPNGSVTYTALAATGEWQVGNGVVVGSQLTRGTVQENHLGSTDQIDFTGLPLQIAQTNSVDFFNAITSKLAGIESGATSDLTGAEIKTLYESEGNTNEFSDSLLGKLNNIEVGAQVNLTDAEVKIAYENNADTNEFSNTLITKLEDIEEDATADQDANEVPYITPLGVSSDNVQDAIDEAFNNINSHNHNATKILYDPTDDNLTKETTVQGALLDHSKYDNSLLTSHTGITSGGRLTAIDGTAKFNVDAGKGVFFDSYTDPLNTIYNPVSWPDFVAVPIVPEIGTMTIVTMKIFIGTDTLGNPEIFKFVGKVGLNIYRDYIYLGDLYIVHGLIIDVVASPSVIKQTATDTYDLFASNSNITGGLIFPVDNLLSIWQQGGTIFYPGINWYDTDHKNPNTLSFSDTSPKPRLPLLFSTIDQLGNIVHKDIKTIPTEHDLNGVITPLTNTNSTIHRLYGIGLNTGQRVFILQYGQEVYPSANDARNNLLLDDFIGSPEIENMHFLAYICVSDQSTDFNDSMSAWLIAGRENITTSNVINKVSGVTISSSPPINPDDGDHWYNSATGKYYIYYTDSTSSQWAEC